jgi:hypothetical protein
VKNPPLMWSAKDVFERQNRQNSINRDFLMLMGP